MKTVILFALTIVTHAYAAQEIDFLSIIKSSAETSRALGIEKLNKDEQAKLNALLNQVYRLGAEQQAKASMAPQGKRTQPNVFPTSERKVYVTKIEDDQNDVLHLANGAIVEITSGFAGYIGYRKDAILYKQGSGWRIWIQGKRAYSCDILKSPYSIGSNNAEFVTISEVKGNGKILTALDGAIYEVSDLNTIDTSLWIGSFEAILIDGTRLVNLQEGGDIIDVTKLR